MTTPTVAELPRHPEPVVHDSFIDDLAARAQPGHPATPPRQAGSAGR